MYNPIHISNFFIQEYGNEHDITPMKLVKLVYVSHGWYLGVTGKALIDENPEAWQYGPVIPTVYHFFKKYRKQPIKNVFLTSDPCKELPEMIQRFLRKIWNGYGKFTALELSSMTHKVGTPWFVTWHNLHSSGMIGHGLGSYSTQIPDNLIRDHYKKKLETSNKVLA